MSAESKKSLGQFLKEERLKKEKTLESIASETKIRLHLLEALEADKYSQLPAKPFLRGFVISYCKAIQYDPQIVLREFKRELDAAAEDGTISSKALGGYTFEDTKSDRSILTIVLFSVSIILIVSLIAFFVIDGKTALQSFFQKNPQSGVSDELSTSSSEVNNTLHEERTKPNPSDTDTVIQNPDTTSPNISAEEPDSQQQDRDGAADTTNADTKTDTDTEITTAENIPGDLPSVEPGRTSAATDSLLKGDTLPADKIHYKVVFKAKDDVWLRYKVDDYKLQTFKLLKNRLIVIRAEKWIYYQVENSQSVLVRFDLDNTYTSLQNKKHFTIYDSFATGVHPRKFSDTIPEIFGTSPSFE